MIKARNFGALLALGALTALPACSMFGGDKSASNSSAQYSQASTAPASNTVASNAAGTSGTVAPVSPGMIRRVQTTLQQNGDYNGRVDGVWGPQTENGVRTWQQAHNLSSNGEIDMATLQSMNISADSSQADNQASQSNANTTNNAANQPANPPNYSTRASQTPGSSYSSNNANPPANTPYPANQATPNNDNSSASSSSPATGSNATH